MNKLEELWASYWEISEAVDFIEHALRTEENPYIIKAVKTKLNAYTMLRELYKIQIEELEKK